MSSDDGCRNNKRAMHVFILKSGNIYFICPCHTDYTVLWMNRDQMGSASVVAPPAVMPLPGSLTWPEIAPESLSPPGKALELFNPVAAAPGSLIPAEEMSGSTIPLTSEGCPAQILCLAIGRIKFFYVKGTPIFCQFCHFSAIKTVILLTTSTVEKNK
jgi:hypothetical protein